MLPPTSPPKAEPVSEAIARRAEAIAEARRARYDAEKAEAKVLVTETVAAAIALCERVEYVEWSDDGDGSSSIGVKCGCESAEFSWDEFGDAHEAGSDDEFEDIGRQELSPRSLDSWAWDLGLKTREGRGFSRMWRHDRFGEQMHRLGVGSDNEPARAALRDQQWWTIEPGDEELSLVLLTHRNRIEPGVV